MPAPILDELGSWTATAAATTLLTGWGKVSIAYLSARGSIST